MRSPTTTSSSDVRIIEVGPRDGLQNIRTTVPTTVKLELIRRLYATGLQSVEITSLVSPRAIPQLADAHHVLGDASVQRKLVDPAARAPVLVPNLKGLDRALAAGVKEVAVFLSATEGFSRANIRCTVAEGLHRATEVAKAAISKGVAVRGYVSCIFADPYSDEPTKHQDVLKVVQALHTMGCYEVSLGDTLGVGTPAQVRSLLLYLGSQGVPLQRLAGHFHDTYGQGVVNAWEAYQCGIRNFDSSVAGLGGCPFAPGAKGNVATEDLVYTFEQAGIRTGVDLEKLADVGAWISRQLQKANDSRTGMALTAKRAGKHSPSVGQQQQGSSTTSLPWTPVGDDTGDLQIFRSGVNAKLVLNRPKNGNALTSAMISGLTHFFESAVTDKTIRRIAITGRGKFFCTGMDLARDTSSVAQGKAESDAQYDRLTRLFEAIDQAPQVTLALINGAAYGGGVGLAFACDIRIAAEQAKFTLSEVKLGLCPATISKYIVREWGFAFAREAMLSARPLTMIELHRLGTVAQLVGPDGDLDQALDRYLLQLKSAAPEASKMAKKLVELGWRHPGAREQETGIKDIFDTMMRADGEASIGLRRFRSKGSGIDWDVEGLKAPQSKL